MTRKYSAFRSSALVTLRESACRILACCIRLVIQGCAACALSMTFCAKLAKFLLRVAATVAQVLVVCLGLGTGVCCFLFAMILSVLLWCIDGKGGNSFWAGASRDVLRGSSTRIIPCDMRFYGFV